jgi:hypothetical protein
MKRSLSDGSGYLEIDHRDSPGLTEADIQHVPGAVAVGKGEHYERDIQMCSHCQRGVVLNPGRVRARAVCLKCNHYICDGCEVIRAATGHCVPFKAVLDKAAELTERFLNQPDHPEAVIDPASLAQPREFESLVVVPEMPQTPTTSTKE